MQRIFDATPVNILLTRGPDHVIAYSNPANTKAAGNREMVGRPIAEALPELKGQNIFEKFDETFQAGERKVFGEFRVELDDGAGGTREMWLSQVLEPQRDGSGNVIGVVSFAYEITEQVRAREAARESEAQKTLLLAELQHRVKNTLATVRAISRFLHDLLTDSDWASTNLCDLVAAEAAPYERAGNGRIHYYGDTLRLNAKEALAFGMAMHELMTNAAKYGALSNETGHIEIDVAATAEGRRVTWREVGGPEVREPENGGGFGMVVIQRVLSSDIGANIDMRFEPSGLIFEARF
jgi:two-component system CheB/CheR fusion protein